MSAAESKWTSLARQGSIFERKTLHDEHNGRANPRAKRFGHFSQAKTQVVTNADFVARAKRFDLLGGSLLKLVLGLE